MRRLSNSSETGFLGCLRFWVVVWRLTERFVFTSLIQEGLRDGKPLLVGERSEPASRIDGALSVGAGRRESSYDV